MDILRFITAGNVDDGKSTLIGRLLHDTSNIKSDVIQSVSDNGSSEINLAHITDGLRSEREQGITIDVAYKYFTTKNRKYIITDAPGHFQYTRNLVTGASGVDAMIILIDVVNGITEQTRRHSLVASFLKIKQVVVAVNKMDLLNFDEHVFNTIRNEYTIIAEKLELQNVTFIPMSALKGDNVSSVSEQMKWYKGETLTQYLESCTPISKNGKTITTDKNIVRLSIQQAATDKDKLENIYYGKLLLGSLHNGDMLRIFPEKEKVLVTKILQGYNEVAVTESGANICVYLSVIWRPKMNITRGHLLSNLGNAPKLSNRFEVTICWLNAEAALQLDSEYLLRIGTKEVICKIAQVLYKIDVNSFEKIYDSAHVGVNEFAKVVFETNEIFAYDTYDFLPETGRGIIIDKDTNYTSGAFIIEN